MALLFSTGVRQGMANATGLKTLFTNGVLYLYSGPQATNADAAVGSATPLCKVTLASGAFVFGTGTNGINFDAPVLGVLDKAAAETWSGACIAAGTIGWFRLCGNASDTFGSSTTLARIDGSVATSGSDLILPVTVVAVSTPIVISVFQLTLPSGA